VSLFKLGRIAEAKLIHEELLDFYSKHYQTTHKVVLDTKYNIAYGFFLEGKYLEAMKLFSEVVEGEYEDESPDDVSAAVSM